MRTASLTPISLTLGRTGRQLRFPRDVPRPSRSIRPPLFNTPLRLCNVRLQQRLTPRHRFSEPLHHSRRLTLRLKQGPKLHPWVALRLKHGPKLNRRLTLQRPLVQPPLPEPPPLPTRVATTEGIGNFCDPRWGCDQGPTGSKTGYLG